jgi:hypothetical protein
LKDFEYSLSEKTDYYYSVLEKNINKISKNYEKEIELKTKKFQESLAKSYQDIMILKGKYNESIDELDNFKKQFFDLVKKEKNDYKAIIDAKNKSNRNLNLFFTITNILILILMIVFILNN